MHEHRLAAALDGLNAAALIVESLPAGPVAAGLGWCLERIRDDVLTVVDSLETEEEDRGEAHRPLCKNASGDVTNILPFKA